MATTALKKSGAVSFGPWWVLGVAGFVVTALVLSIGEIFSAADLSFLQVVIESAGVAVILPIVYTSVAASFATDQPTAEAGQPQTSQLMDAVTGVHNRRGITIYLIELMALAERYHRNFSVAVVGPDYLDQVVADFGETAGDESLQVIAESISDALRMPDRVGRHSDEEFLLILPETDLESARQIAERVRLAVADAQVRVAMRKTIHPTVSIGLTEFRLGDDLEQLISRAQQAVANAMQEGHNRVTYIAAPASASD